MISRIRMVTMRVMATILNRNAKAKSTVRQIEPIQVAIDRGIDVSMIADNLQRSVTERIRRHRIALNMVERLRKAKRL